MESIAQKKKIYSNNFINGESVNYVLSMLFSFFILIVIKQFFKTFIGLSAEISAIIGFISSEIVLYFVQRFFVYKDKGLNSTLMQIVFSVIGTGIHLGIYQLIKFIFCKNLGAFDFTAWLITFTFVFIINYPYSRILVFDCLDSPNENKNGRIYKLFFENRFIFLSMLIALLGIGFIYSVFKVFPFGDTTVLRMDLYHQYGPLFVELFDRVTNGDSFLYSWISGGGSSFLGNFFNYLSSPLNILIFLFDRDEMSYAITFLVALKCILSAGTFTFFIKKSLKNHSYSSASFGVLYAFSAYFLAYFWNIMWLDGMFILPLIALGIENIINDGKCKLYFFSLIYILFANYYIGFMTCIFSVIYFIAYYFLICDKRSVVDENIIFSDRFSLKKLNNNLFFNRGIKFALTSIIAAAVCASFLIPVYFILTGSSATSGNFPKSFESYFTIFDFIESHFAGLETTIRSSGEDVLPNIYSGIICLLLVPLFVVNKDIKIKDKAVYIALLLFFLFSFNNNCANYIWHALHFPNDLPYRFSYMYSFIMLIVAFKSFTSIKSLGLKEISFVGLFWIAFVAIAQELPTNKISESTIYITTAFIIIWTAVLLLVKKQNASKLILGILIISVTFCEVIISDTSAFSLAQKQTEYVKNYNTYTDAIENVKKDDDSFYKMELCHLNTRMDPCIYGYNGISTFSSMAYENYSRLQYSLGMYGNRINSYTYNPQTPIYNMMYNIKYLIYNNQETKPSTNLYTRFYETKDTKSIVYENDYFLPISYGVDTSIYSWDVTEGNPFRVQGDFFSLATGLENVFKDVDFVNCEYNGISGNEVTENGTFWIKRISDFGDAEITLNATTNGNVYVYFSSSDIKSVTFKIGEKTINQNIETPHIIDLGYFNAGESATISFESTGSDSRDGNFQIYAYSVDQNVLNEGYQKLSENALKVKKFTDTKIVGNINVKNDCVLYSSIPYDEGWNVYIDGKKAEKFEIGNAQLGVQLESGNHEIKYKYSPKGIKYSIPISVITILGIVIYAFLSKKRKK